mmetsp:Transcript_62154/g.116270  ORF Transcript_62154/g.116270 Transcript_62154/m.116270 type:complete len:213 (-) Transcript_62154:287-925(-)
MDHETASLDFLIGKVCHHFRHHPSRVASGVVHDVGPRVIILQCFVPPMASNDAGVIASLALVDVDPAAVGSGAWHAAAGVETCSEDPVQSLCIIRGLNLEAALNQCAGEARVLLERGLRRRLDDTAGNASTLIVVDDHGTPQDVHLRGAGDDGDRGSGHCRITHAGVVHDGLPWILRVRGRVPVVAADCRSITAGHTLVDMHAAAVGSRASL